MQGVGATVGKGSSVGLGSSVCSTREGGGTLGNASVGLSDGLCDLVGVGVGECATSLLSGRTGALCDGEAVAVDRGTDSVAYSSVLPVSSSTALNRNRPSLTT